MINHFAIGVSNHKISSEFYKASLAGLGYLVHREDDKFTGFTDGISADPFGDFAIYEGKAFPFHIAFQAKSNEDVDAWYAAGMAHGGKDNGAPGYRKDYHEHYYAAFIIDPDGYRLEAVCHNGQPHGIENL